MQCGMGLLALACIGLGVAPFAAVPFLVGYWQDSVACLIRELSSRIACSSKHPGFLDRCRHTDGVGLVILARHCAFSDVASPSEPPPAPGDSWGCGRIGQTARMEYTATAFAEPFMRFAEIYRPMKELTVDLSRVQILRAIHRIPERNHALVRSIFIQTISGERHVCRPAGSASASRVIASLSFVHRHYADALTGCRKVVLTLEYAIEVSQAVFALALAPMVVGFVRWLKARMQNRRGAPPGSLLELVKLLGKEVVVSQQASWLFRCVPHIVFASTLAVTFLVPFLFVPGPLDGVGDLLAVVYLLLLANILFSRWPGLDPGTAFGGMGSSREMTVAAIAEPTIAVAIFSLALGAGSTNLGRIVTQALGNPATAISPGHLLAFAALFIVALLKPAACR